MAEIRSDGDTINYLLKSAGRFPLLPSRLETPQESLDALGERDRLEQILCGIDKREAYVLGLRYGLDQDEGRSLAEAGEMLGVSRERVRWIEAKAIRSAQGGKQSRN
ncbi:MAG: hypothetical protein MH252_03340 [Thermosynechococcaceae cyanobacterium MS004]|nr:hypothetical protein [Thermosynechococcaceae cyanobacterium MS004]